MNRRHLAVVVLLAALVAVVVLDLRERHARSALDANRQALALRLASLARDEQVTKQEIDAQRARAAELRNSAVVRLGLGSVEPTSSAGALSPADRVPGIANSNELRSLRVRAFVGEERMKFGAVLHQLGLTPEQLRRFDEIEGEYEEATLDLASTAKAQGVTNPADLAPLRRKIAASRDAQLRELLGDGYAAWQEASRTQGARQTVDDLLRQTFQSAGPVDDDHAQAFVRVVQRHAPSKTSSGYDWNAIATDAAGVFTGPQLDAIRTALELRKLSDQMSAVSTGRHP